MVSILHSLQVQGPPVDSSPKMVKFSADRKAAVQYHPTATCAFQIEVRMKRKSHENAALFIESPTVILLYHQGIKMDSSEERFIRRELFKGLATAIAGIVFFSFFVYFLRDMPTWSKGNVVWYFSITGVICSIILTGILLFLIISRIKRKW